MKIKINKTLLNQKLLEYGYTIAELQRRANISNYTIYGAVNQGKHVRASTVKKMADVLGVDVNELAVIENDAPTVKGA